MAAMNPDEIISILKEEIKNYDEISKDQEVGTVISVGDGIATVHGIDHAMYGEVVTFENGLKGMVQDIRANSIGCILFGKDTGIKEGTKVARTQKQAGVPVGDAFIGRIVNALGAPIDGKGEIKADGYRPVENPAPGIIDRKSVTVPLETGILSIDSMFPIGRGQLKNNRQFKLDDQIRICYQFSRELEHSDLNLNRFEELMSEKEIFSFENLLKIC